MIPGQGFYKGNDFHEKQQQYALHKKQLFTEKIAKLNIKSLDAIIIDIQNKIQQYNKNDEIKQLAKKTSEYFCFLPTTQEIQQLEKL